jgi:hypothetical protein
MKRKSSFIYVLNILYNIILKVHHVQGRDPLSILASRVLKIVKWQALISRHLIVTYLFVFTQSHLPFLKIQLIELVKG